jgi:ribosomal-protein-serine acetyltransferase
MITLPVEEGVRLRTLDLHDAEELFALTDSSRRYLREWLPWLDATQSVGDTRTFIESALRQLAANAGFQMGIWNAERLVGVIGYHHHDWMNRSTNIGYWLGEQYQGRGIMTKSCSALVEYAFESWSMHRVEIRCAVGNLKSRGIPERLGFQQEGLLRDAEWLYNHYVDHIVYGMLDQEWKSPLRVGNEQFARITSS